MSSRGEELTGPMSRSAVSSRTFSIWDFEGSIGGGLTKVARDMVDC